MFDPVNKPKHYNPHPSGIECIQVIEHMNFNLGNAVKSLWRTDHKNGLEDLKKARLVHRPRNSAPRKTNRSTGDWVETGDVTVGNTPRRASSI